jgi:hypothetical protein
MIYFLSLMYTYFTVLRCQSCQTWPAKFGQILLRTDTRLVFCNRKLMRTDIFFTRTTKHICNFANSIVLMFNININYTTARMDYAISVRPSRTPIVIRRKSRWTKYKIHNKIYPIQHSARSGKRCIEVTNRDEYKNITTRNVVVFFRCPSWTSRLIRWHYKPTAAIRRLNKDRK